MKTPYRPLHRPMIDLRGALLAGTLFFVGCAFDLANIHPTPITLTPCRQNCKSLTINQTFVLTNITCGYDRTIKQGSIWKLAGRVPQGEVYKPVNTCLTLECSNVFEAYLVLRRETIVGFYLPVEKGFVPLGKPTPLPPHQ